MPYQYILANLLADVDDVDGVLFVDDEGETVDVAGRPDGELDLKIQGAYLGIYVQRVVSLAEEQVLGRPRVLFIERPGLTLVARALSGGYCLGLIQRSSRSVGRLVHSLERAAADLEREVLSEIER